MISSKERTKWFLQDLHKLLKKHEAEFDVTYDSLEFGADIKGIHIHIPEIVSKIDMSTLLAEEVNIQLTKYFDVDTIKRI